MRILSINNFTKLNFLGDPRCTNLNIKKTHNKDLIYEGQEVDLSDTFVNNSIINKNMDDSDTCYDTSIFLRNCEVINDVKNYAGRIEVENSLIGDSIETKKGFVVIKDSIVGEDISTKNNLIEIRNSAIGGKIVSKGENTYIIDSDIYGDVINSGGKVIIAKSTIHEKNKKMPKFKCGKEKLCVFDTVTIDNKTCKKFLMPPKSLISGQLKFTHPVDLYLGKGSQIQYEEFLINVNKVIYLD